MDFFNGTSYNPDGQVQDPNGNYVFELTLLNSFVLQPHNLDVNNPLGYAQLNLETTLNGNIAIFQ
jgi:hypothetical protein